MPVLKNNIEDVTGISGIDSLPLFEKFDAEEISKIIKGKFNLKLNIGKQ